LILHFRIFIKITMGQPNSIIKYKKNGFNARKRF